MNTIDPAPHSVETTPLPGAIRLSEDARYPVAFPRLLIGVIVLICAEVFSGASIQVGLWNPWTWLMTYWLYFAHFFFFTTLAIRTGRTSLGALYLWGVLYGLYESWITKVIWSGYSGDGKFALGPIGPFGYSEISMVFFFHPVASFILPLAVVCLLCPSVRRLFPSLAWLTGTRKLARVVQAYLVVSCISTMAVNSGGPLNFALNLAFMFVVLLGLLWLARPGLAAPEGRPIVEFGWPGLASLCIYLALLYSVTYVYLRPNDLPTLSVQLLTLAFYALTITGLCLYRRRTPLPDTTAGVAARELQLVKLLFALMLILALGLSFLAKTPFVSIAVVVNLVVWTPLGFVLTAVAFVSGA
ncbi:MAG: hypothetical protein ACYC3X_23850 [Pirellulaceae bacterium]